MAQLIDKKYTGSALRDTIYKQFREDAIYRAMCAAHSAIEAVCDTHKKAKKYKEYHKKAFEAAYELCLSPAYDGCGHTALHDSDANDAYKQAAYEAALEILEQQDQADPTHH